MPNAKKNSGTQNKSVVPIIRAPMMSDATVMGIVNLNIFALV